MKRIYTSRRKKIQSCLLEWYDKNGRHDLPWRKTSDLYHITVAEIMLQQTNVPKVIDKYKIFLKKFPTWEKLAIAKQSDVVILWQGLGYNRRAVNLHRLSKIIVTNYAGKIPLSQEALQKLPGLGPYTSASILIFGLNHNLSAPDVNIIRVIRRLYGEKILPRSIALSLAARFVPENQSYNWHSALMDFANSVCLKRVPKCYMCPLSLVCFSYPDPQDFFKQEKKEPGRMELYKHIPRRIYRGRIIEALRFSALSFSVIGQKIKKDWDIRQDRVWLREILSLLEKEQLIEKVGHVWQLKK